MDIPETVVVLGVPYKVERGGCEPDEDGYCSPSKRVIAIREGLGAESEAQTFLHEVLHAFWSSGILTGNQTASSRAQTFILFWSSGILTGNQTSTQATNIAQ